jgi:hypothetical protein
MKGAFELECCNVNTIHKQSRVELQYHSHRKSTSMVENIYARLHRKRDGQIFGLAISETKDYCTKLSTTVQLYSSRRLLRGKSCTGVRCTVLTKYKTLLSFGLTVSG